MLPSPSSFLSLLAARGGAWRGGRTLTRVAARFACLTIGLSSLGPTALRGQSISLSGGGLSSISSGSSATVVDSQLTVSSTPTITGATVNIASGFKSGDVLAATVGSSGMTATYNSTTGTLTLTGTVTAAVLQTVFRTVTFQPSATTGVRTITFAMGASVAYAGTGHFYQYVSFSATWDSAKTNAASRTYLGLQGYLATITSQGENDFIKAKLVGDGWIGCRANLTSWSGRYWYWATGPEAGTEFCTNPSAGVTVSYNGGYSNWASGEPNSSSPGEDRGQIYIAGGTWNDLSSTGSQAGYVIEYGGLVANDAAALSASQNVTVGLNLPTITTPSASNLNATAAALGGTITSAGDGMLTGRGIVYALSSVNASPQIGGNAVTQVADSAATTGIFGVSVTGLASGATYAFAAYATNAGGTVYTGSAQFTTLAVPGAPTSVAAVAGNALATVSFTAPASTGGTAITGYTVTSSPGGFTGTGAASPITVTGLTNGTSYTFTVTATNSVGTGAASSASAAVTPATIPGAPTIGTATAGNTQATVTFTAPVSTGGATITGYTVTSSPAGGTDSNAGTTGLSHIVTGLTNGTAYTFTVKATNSAGTGAASAASSSATPATIPGAPTAVTAAGGVTQALVSFTAPVSNGGSAVTGYTVTSSPAGGTDSSAGSTGLSHLVTGLTNGTAYTFTVKATNAVGPSVASAASNSVTPSTFPQPTIASVVAGNQIATVYFLAPVATGGSAIQYYTATAYQSGVATSQTNTTYTFSATGGSVIVTGLTNGTTYTFVVAATNAAGSTSVASAASTGVVPSATSSLSTDQDFKTLAVGNLSVGSSVDGWVLTTGQNSLGVKGPNSTAATVTNPPLTLTDLSIQTGGSLKAAVVGGATPLLITDPATVTAPLKFAVFAPNALLINDTIVNATAQQAASAGASYSTIIATKTYTVAAGEVSPADGRVHVRFAVAPVLSAAGHNYNQQPYEFVQIQNVTNGGVTLYSNFNSAGAAGVPWNLSNSIYWTNWQMIDWSGPSQQIKVGDQIKVTVVAAGCSQSGHWGRAYINVPPGALGKATGSATSGFPLAFVSATGPANAATNTNFNYTFSYENKTGAAIAAAVCTISIPTGTTYQSCSFPNASLSGTDLTVNLGALPDGGAGTFTVTVKAGGTTGQVTLGTYILTGGTVSAYGTKVYTTVYSTPITINLTASNTSYGAITTYPDAGSVLAFANSNTSSQTVPQGTSIGFTATPQAGCTFTGWSGSSTSASATITLVANATINLTATFGSALQPSTVAVTGGTYSYNGSAQGPSTATATGSAGAVTYSYAGASFSSAPYGPSATAPTNAGNYTVTATVAADATHTGASSSAAAFTINPAASTVSVTEVAYAYDGSPHGPNTATVVGSSGAITYSYAGTTAAGVGYGPSATAPNLGGTYTVTATVAADNNWTTASSGAVTFSIGNAPPTLVAVAVSGTEDTTLTFVATNFTDAYNDLDGTALASITVVTLPATGTLKLAGTNVTAAQVIPAANLGNLTYVPAANENGAKTFTVKASDGSLSSAVATVTMTLAAVNDAPTLGAVAVSGTEDTTLTFAATDFTGGYTDTEIAALASITVVTLPATGALKLAGTNVTAAQVIPAASLGNLTYVPAANENGAKTFTVTASDGSQSSAAATVTMALAAVNDAPTLATPTAASYADTAGPDTFTAATGTLVGADVDANTTLTYGIQAVIAVSGVATQVGTYGTLAVTTASGAYTFTPNAAAINALSAAASETYTMTVSDGTATTTATYTVNLTGVNDTPTVSAPSGFAVTEDVAGNVRYTGTPFGDVDSATLTVTLAVADGTITGNAGAGITVTGTATARYFAGTIAALNTYFTTAGSITYQGAANNTTARTLTSTVSDGSLSASTTSTVTFTAVNDAPVAAASTLTAIAEDVADGSNPGTLVSALVANFTDADSGAVSGIAVTGVDAANGTWYYSTNAGGAWTSLTGSTSAARLLKGDDANYKVRFVPAANFNGTATFTYQAWDQTSGTAGSTAAVTTNGGGTAFSSNSGTGTIAVAAANDAPVAAASTLTTIAEDVADGSNPGTLVSALVANFTDADAGAVKGIAVTAVDTTNGTWQYTTDGGATWSTLSTSNTETFAATTEGWTGGTLYNTGATWGSILGRFASPGMTITKTYLLSGAATALTFDFFRLDSWDGELFKLSANSALIINQSFTVNAIGTTLSGSASGYTWTMVPAGTATVANSSWSDQKFAVTLNVPAGVTTLALQMTSTLDQDVTDESWGIGNFVSPGLSARTARLLKGDDPNYKVRFVPSANFNGTATFTYQAWDQTSGTAGGTADAMTSGGSTAFSSNTTTGTITVTPVNDAPTLTTVRTLTGGTEDTSLTISYETLASAANGADLDGDTVSFRIEAVSTGTLTKGGSAVIAGTTLLATGESLVWTPALNANGTLTAFTIKGWDGALASASAVQVSVAVAAVNDAPVVSAPASFALTEDVAGNLTYTGTPFADVDSATLTVTLSVTDGTITGNTGTGITVGGTATVATFAGTVADLNTYFTTAGKITYQGLLNNTDSRTLTTAVSDGARSASTTSAINFTPVNDAPVMTATARVLATGGTITTSGIYTIHTFTAVGTSTFTPAGAMNVEVLVVGGGGSSIGAGGGGGGGGVVYASSYAVTATGYNVIVGGGGVANMATAGGNSSFAGIIGYGGGAGGRNQGSGGSGGSGGGAGRDYTGVGGSATKGIGGTAYGNPGGNGPGGSWGGGSGGGGAGAAGSGGVRTGDSVGERGGAGGAGIVNAIMGVETYYGGGGGGGNEGNGNVAVGGVGGGGAGGSTTVAAESGLANTGGGGGGAKNIGSGGGGGSGIVIVRYTSSNGADITVDYSDTVASDTFSSSTGTLSATDVDASTTLTYGIQGVSAGSGVATQVGTYGTLAVTPASGAYTFTPNAAAINALSANTTETFTVTVSDGTATITATLTVNLTGVNDTPVAAVPGAQSGAEDATLAFSGSRVLTVADVDNNLATARVTVAKGTVAVTLGGSSPATISAGANASATLTLAGTVAQVNAALATLVYTPTTDFYGSDTLTLLATDSGGLSATGTVALTVTPVVDVVAHALATTLDVAATVNVLTGAPKDGFANLTAAVTAVGQGAHGAATYTAGGALTYTPATNYDGADSFTYTVTSGGATETGTVTVTVTNRAPTVSGPATAMGAEDTPLAFTGSDVITAADPDSNLASVQVTVTKGTLNVTLTSGATLSAGAANSATLTVAGPAAAINATLATLVYTPNADYNGSDTLTVLATDGKGSTGSGTVTLTTTPVVDVVAHTLATTLNAAATVNVLTGTPRDTFTDPAAAVTTVTQGAHGTVTYAADGALTHMPTTNYDGPDSFTYTVTSGGVTETGTVAVTVTNQAPTVTVPATATVAEDMPLAFTGAQAITAADPDSNLASVQVTVTKGKVNVTLTGGATLSAGAANSVTLTVAGSAAAINATLAALVYTPNADFNGSDTATVLATDGKGSTGSGTVALTITPVMDVVPHTLATTLNVVATVNVLTGTPRDTFTDPAVAVTAVGQGAHGTVTYPAGGALTYTPAANYDGADSFTYTVTSGGVTETGTVTVTVTNQAPTVSGPATATVAEDTPLAFTAANVITAADPDSNLASVQVTVTEGVLNVALNGGATLSAGAPNSVTLTVAGPAAAINATLATLVYTPNADYNGSDTATVLATDGKGSTGSGTVALTVTPVVDVVAHTLATTLNVAATLNVLTGTPRDTFTDPAAAVTVVGQGEHGTVTYTAGGALTYTPAANYDGADSFTYTATSGGVTETGAVAVTVRNRAPTVSIPPTETVAEDTPLAFTGSDVITAGDPDSNLASVQVTVTNGTLNVTLTSGATLSAGAANSATLTVVGTTAAINATLATLVHTPNADFNGSDTVSVLATDGKGATGSGTVALTITPVVDVVPHTLATTLNAAATVNVLTGTPRDTFTDPAAAVTAVTQGAHGTVTYAAGGALTYTPATNYDGADSFTYTVTSGGVTETGTVTVTVTNRAPTVTVPATATVAEDTPLAFTGANLITAADLDDNLTSVQVTVTKGKVNATLTGGATLSAGAANSVTLTVVGPAAAINATLATLVYTPNADYNGSDAVTVQAIDGKGTTGGGTVTLTITPVADVMAHTLATTLNVVATVNVLTGTPKDTFTDPAAAVTAVTQGAHGAVTYTPGGALTYTPAANYDGADSFNYTMSSGGVTETGTVTVSVLNQLPTLTAPATVTVAEDMELVFTGVNAISVGDPDGNLAGVQVTVTKGTLNATLSGWSTLSVGASNTTTLSAINGTLATLVYRPNADFNGSDTLTVQAWDEKGARIQGTVALTITPVVDVVPHTLATTLNVAATVHVLTGTPKDTFADPTAAVTAVSQGAHGAVTYTAGGALTYTPAANYDGADSFTYTVTSGGVTETGTVAVTVLNRAPTVAAPATATLVEDTPLACIGAQAITAADLDGNLASVQVTVTKGKVNATLTSGATLSAGAADSATLTVAGSAAAINATLATLVYTPIADFNGSDTLTVLATDGNGLTGSSTVALTVTPVVDVVAHAVTTTVNVAATVYVLTGTPNDTFTDPAAAVTSASQGAHGTVTYTAGGALTYTPATNYAGTDSFTYTVTSGGVTETGTVAVTVTNRAPTVTAPATAMLAEDTPLVFAGVHAITAADLDSNLAGVQATVTKGKVNVILTGGATLSAGAANSVTFTVAGSAAAINATLATLVYTPNADYNGSDTLTVLATDGSGSTGSGIVSLTITQVIDVVPHPLATTLNVAATLNVLTGTPKDTFMDPTAAVTAVTQGAHGLVTYTAGGALTYTPAANYDGADSFTYTVTSGGVTETGTVAVTVTNRAPTVSVPATATVAEDTPLAFIGAAVITAADPDSNLASVQVTVTKGTLNVTLTGGATLNVGAANSATLTVAGSAAAINATLATLVYTPNADYNGSDTATVLATDGKGSTGSETVALTVTPVVDVVPHTLATTLNVAATLNVLTGTPKDTFTDPAAAVTAVTQGAHGLVTYAAGGALTYTPAANYDGADSFTYTVTSGGVTETGTVAATVTNRVPTVIVPATATVAEDTPLAFTGANVISAADLDSNLAGVQVTVTKGSVNVTLTGGATPSAGATLSAGAANSATLTVAGSAAAINATLATLVYTPNADCNGSDTVSVLATDGKGLTGSGTLVLTVTPVVDVVPHPLTTTLNVAATLNVLTGTPNDTFTDPTAAVTAVSQGAHGLVTYTAGGALTYTPATNYDGADSFTYTVTSGGVTETGTVAVTVTNRAPTVSVPATATVAEDTPLAFDGANVITAADQDSNLAGVQVTVTKGKVNVILTGGATLSAGAANSVTFTVAGSAAAINATLATLVYTPNADYNGSDTLTVLATDGSGSTGSGIVSLTITQVIDVVPHPLATLFNVAATVNVLAGTPADTFAGPATVTAVTAGSHGSVSSAAAGALTYTPAANYIGTDRFTYTVANNGASETGTVLVTVTKLPPVVSTVAVNGTQDTVVPFATANFTAAYSDSDRLPLASITLVTLPSTGVLKLAGVAVTPGQVIPAVNLGDLTYTPAAGETGYKTFLATASDGFASSSPGTVAIFLQGTSGPLSLVVSAAASLVVSTNGEVTLSETASLPANAQVVGVDLLLDYSTSWPPSNQAVAGNYVKLNGTAINSLGWTSAGNAGEWTYVLTQCRGPLPPYLVGGSNTWVIGSWWNPVELRNTTLRVYYILPPALGPVGVSGNEDATVSFAAENFRGVYSDPQVAPLASITVASLPATGGLMLAGASVSPGQVIPAASLGALTYVPAQNENGAKTFTVTASDGTLSSAPATITITLGPVNDAPVHSVPAAQTTNSNTPRVFSSANGNALVVADVDAGAGALTVSLQATHGTMTLGAVAGLAFAPGDGTAAAATLQFSGTTAAINAALNGLSFTPATDYAGPATITLTTSDNGNSGVGGALSATDIVPITVLDTIPPTVVGLSAVATSGHFRTSTVVDILVNFSEPVQVDVTGGVPALQLEVGAATPAATYRSGSGSAALVFRYVVGAGDTTEHLNHAATTALQLNGGTIRDPAGNAAVLTLPAPAVGTPGALATATTIVLDTTAPTLALSAPSPDYTNSGPVTFTLAYADTHLGAPTLAAGDITLVKTGTADGRVAVSGTGAGRTVTISAVTGDGTLAITVAAGTAADLAGNSAPAAGLSAAFAVQNTFPIAITVPPVAVNLTVGMPLILSVTVTGTAPQYQWYKDSLPLNGATNATLEFAAIPLAAAGVYSVAVQNTLNRLQTAPVAVAVYDVSAAHALVGPGYVAGQTVTIQHTLTFTGGDGTLTWSLLLPAGWQYAGGTAEAEVRPQVGASGLAEWTWRSFPVSPILFTTQLLVPAGATGTQVLAAQVTFTRGGVTVPLLARPDPLVAAEIGTYSADLDADGRIDLMELLRVIELYNTRFETTRTGAYRVLAGTEDGFAPDFTRTSGASAALSAYHTADTDRDGRINLTELTRVIEFYNYRYGTVRTGAYHRLAGTEDGYDAGPGSTPP